MAIEQITDHGDQAVARLVHQFKEKARIEGLVRAFVVPLQGLEETFVDLLNFRWIDVAIGKQLDGLGSIVGEPRQGREDSEYRRAIVTRIAINTSKGTPENLITIFNFLTESERSLYIPLYPAEVEIYADRDIEYSLAGDGGEAFAFEGGIDGVGFGDFFDPSIGGTFAYLVANDTVGLFLTCDSVIAGGVRIGQIGWYDGDEAFSFEGDPLMQGKGFGDALDSTIGGKFAKVVEIHFPFSFGSDSRRTRGFGDPRDILVGGELQSA